jgi:hypothetical protein
MAKVNHIADALSTFGQHWKEGAALAVGVGFPVMCSGFLGLLGTVAVFFVLELFWHGPIWDDIEGQYYALGMYTGIAIFGPVFLSQAMDVFARGPEDEPKDKGRAGT